MKFIQGSDRSQISLFPLSIEAAVDQDNEVRLIDLFVESLDLTNLGFEMDFDENGRPAYHPKDLLKLFIYGYMNRIRSSRALERESKRNIELMLNTIDFQSYEDEIIENQKNFLRPKIDINYSEIQKAEKLSKNGKNQEALTILKNLISQNRLTELHHESYGWIIYRYIKAEESNLSSVEVRTFFRDYMNLKNERPSMLHSMILNFALNYSKTHSDFKFYNFFLLWNPDNLRNEDLHNGYKDGKDIPSLISRICRELLRMPFR